MSILSNLLDSVAEFADQYKQIIAVLGYYFPTITLATAVLNTVIATFPLTLYGEALKERWVKYFGWAFAVLTVQYILQAIASWLLGVGWSGESEQAGTVAHALFSPANTLLLIAAGRDLLSCRKLFPWWSWISALIASLFSLLPLLYPIMPESWLTRLPDATFSAFALGVLGWAMFTNVEPQWQKPQWQRLPSVADVWQKWRTWLMAWLVMGGSIVYAMLHIIYICNPILAERMENEIVGVPILKALDATVFALAFPLKLVLFAGALFLILRSLVVLSPYGLRRILRGVTEEKLEYLSSEGIVATIAKSLDADAVQLYFKLPGHHLQKKPVAWWCWYDESEPSKSAKKRITTELPSKSTVAGWVLTEGKLYNNKDTDNPNLCWSEPDGQGGNFELASILAIPISYHGSVIAGLNIGWANLHSMMPTSVQRIRFIADLLAPAVEARRELSTLYYLGTMFQRQELVLPDRRGDAAVRRLTKIIHPTLSSIVTGVTIEIGFRAAYAVRSDHKKPFGIIPGGESLETCERIFNECIDKIPTRTFKESLMVEGVEVGTMLLAEHLGNDTAQRPSLVSDWLLRATVSIMLADAIFSATRVRLWAILDRLQVEMNRKGYSSIADWFSLVDKAAREAGALWVVADFESKGGLFGQDQSIDLIGRLPQAGKKISESIEHFKLLHLQDETRHVLRLSITPESRLYLGISRMGFGEESRNKWPWRIFLDRFIVAVGASLTRIEVTQLREDALHQQGLVTASVVTGTLVHQLGNMANNLTFVSHSLEQAVKTKELQAPPRTLEKIEAMGGVIRRLREVTTYIGDVTKLDDRRPCHLIEAIQRSEKLFTQVLAEKGVDLQIDINDDLQIDMPLYVPTLVIANLVSNSIDAILRGGVIPGCINVTSEDKEGLIYCRIVDNGPGIEPGLEEKIFDLNVSTRKGSSGLGLYLARRSIRENNGDLKLIDPTPGKTEFAIVFPKERKGGFHA